MDNKKGLIHIYTGEGKGKTTAAVGLATRALGHNLRVCYASFHKNPEKYGYCEIQSLQKLGAETFSLAKGHPHLDKSLDPERIKKETFEGLDKLKERISTRDFDLLILDEILISVRDHFLPEEDLIQFIRQKPAGMELVLTGRGATKRLTGLADYVTSMTAVKHPYTTGIKSREGIEY